MKCAWCLSPEVRQKLATSIVRKWNVGGIQMAYGGPETGFRDEGIFDLRETGSRRFVDDQRAAGEAILID